MDRTRTHRYTIARDSRNFELCRRYVDREPVGTRHVNRAEFAHRYKCAHARAPYLQLLTRTTPTWNDQVFSDRERRNRNPSSQYRVIRFDPNSSILSAIFLLILLLKSSFRNRHPKLFLFFSSNDRD